MWIQFCNGIRDFIFSCLYVLLCIFIGLSLLFNLILSQGNEAWIKRSYILGFSKDKNEILSKLICFSSGI